MLAARTVAIMAIAVDPIDDRARQFYTAFGFRSLLGPDRQMFLTLLTDEQEFLHELITHAERLPRRGLLPQPKTLYRRA